MILTLLNAASDSRFVIGKWNIVKDESNANYNEWKEIIYNTKVLKSNFCDYNDASILVRGNITIIRQNIAHAPFINFAPFIKCVTEIDWLYNNKWCFIFGFGYVYV